jgi:hypothetical protein
MTALSTASFQLLDLAGGELLVVGLLDHGKRSRKLYHELDVAVLEPVLGLHFSLKATS